MTWPEVVLLGKNPPLSGSSSIRGKEETSTEQKSNPPPTKVVKVRKKVEKVP